MGKYPVSKCLNLPRAAGKEQNERKAEAREVVCDQMTQKAQGVHCTMGNRKREKGRHVTIMRAKEDKGKTSMCNVCQGHCYNHLTPSRQMGKTKAQYGSNKVDGK